MKHLKISAIAALCLFIGACSSTKQEPVYDVPLAQDNVIALQNLKSRVLLYCFASQNLSADDCAKHFEQKGYVRLKDIPQFPAQYDFLKADTYPTRRWRKGEVIPRW